MASIYFRHEKPRIFQKEMMDDVYSAIAERKILLAHAPTGSGKTDASLSAAITYAVENDLTVFFLTPKISQHRIAMDVVRGIAQKYDLKIKAVDLIGRRNACIDDTLAMLDHDGFYQSCEKKRKNGQCVYYRNAKGNGRYGEAHANMLFNKMLEQYGAGKYHAELMAMAVGGKACPYEWMLRLGSASQVIIADYLHFMIPSIRDLMLMKMKKSIDHSIIIADEAHNLGKRVREHMSSTVNSYMMGRAEKELMHLGLTDMSLSERFDKWSGERLKDTQEKVVSTLGFNNFLLDLGKDMDALVCFLEDAGMMFVENTGRKSACLKISRFITEWQEGEGDCIRILRRKGTLFSLSKRYLDPSKVTRILNETVSSVLMSGTLVPMAMHRDVLGLDKQRTITKHYPSPFEERNIVNIITADMTTRYSKRDEEHFRKMAGSIDRIIENTPGGTAVFFPSYSVLKKVVPIMKSGSLLIQYENMRQDDLRNILDDFSRNSGVLVAVQGGSLAEGVDYPGGEIKTAVVVGVALDEMGLETEALIDYYDEKFGRGWDYGYLYPGTIKALQAAGRGRRKESDRVAVVYMDERFKWKKYNWIFEGGEKVLVTANPEEIVKKFWDEMAD